MSTLCAYAPNKEYIISLRVGNPKRKENNAGYIS